MSNSTLSTAEATPRLRFQFGLRGLCGMLSLICVVLGTARAMRLLGPFSEAVAEKRVIAWATLLTMALLVGATAGRMVADRPLGWLMGCTYGLLGYHLTVCAAVYFGGGIDNPAWFSNLAGAGALVGGSFGGWMSRSASRVKG